MIQINNNLYFQTRKNQRYGLVKIQQHSIFVNTFSARHSFKSNRCLARKRYLQPAEWNSKNEMINFDNIKTYTTDFPKTWSFLWSPEEASKISQEHKDQIFFLNDEASKFVKNYIDSSKMVTGPLWKPFNERYFKSIDEFEITENCESEIKKWLYNKPIPFDKYVFIDSERSGQSVTLTWKMVIKYWQGLFFADDLIIFDESLNWGLFYFHEDRLYFGAEKIYDKEFEYEKTRELNDLKQKFFNKDNLTFNNEDKKKSARDFKEKYNSDKLE